MRSRAEAVALIERQLEGEHSRDKPNTHHYGVQELRELMDFIYEGEPKTAGEVIVGDGQKRPGRRNKRPPK